MRPLVCLLALTCAAVVVAQQYPPGSQYPGSGGTGGGIPRIPGIPRRGGKNTPAKTKKDAEQQQLETLKGSLRQLNSVTVTLTAADQRNITAKRSAQTKFLRDGKETETKDWQPGDQIRIEAYQDDEGFFHAVSVHFERVANEQERAASAAPVEISTQASQSPDDDDRPVIRRKNEPSAAKPAEQASVATQPPSPVAVPAEEPGELRRGALAPMAEKPIDPDDPGRPKTQRGKPSAKPAQRRPTPEPVEVVASAAPPPKPSPAPVAAAKGPEWKSPEYSADVAGAPASRRDSVLADPRIAKTRESINGWMKSLPNYVCKENIARFVSSGRPVNWRPVDLVSTDLVYEDGKERYTAITINGKAVKKNMEELSGAWSTGEFGTLINDLFSPATDADFRLGSSTTISGRDAIAYTFTVDQPNSHWHVQTPSQTFNPAYKGSVWIDRETSVVLRIEMQAFRLPKAFPLDAVESAVDFEYIRIGDRQFFVPVHAETLSCIRNTSDCSRNVIDFRNYRKFEGKSSIIFD